MEKEKLKIFFGEIGKAVLISLIAVLTGTLIFSIVVKSALLGSNVIKIVNQFIKTLAVFSGCFFSLKKEKGFLKGLSVGLIFTVCVYAVFAVIGGAVKIDGSFFLDMLFCSAIGVVSGIIAVNARRNDR